MALVVDSQGIPLAYETFKGNLAETKTLIPVLEKLRKRFSINNVTVVCDRGLASKPNVEALKKNNEIQIYEIIDGSPESRAKTNSFGQSVKTLERYTYKFLPDNVSLTAADILIYDGYVSIINIGERPTGVVLKNNDYYKNSKELFDFIWQLLPENK